MRVPNSIIYRTTLNELNDIAEDNNRLTLQAGTGLRINKPSDDPTAAVRSLRLRREMAQQQTAQTSLASGLDDLRATELAIDDTIQLLQRAKELGIEVANGAHMGAGFDAIAEEADQLLQAMVSVANRQAGGRSLFGGTLTTTPPYTTTGQPFTAVTFTGNTERRYVSPAPGVEVTTALPGSQAFSDGGTGDVFAALMALRDAARSHDIDALAGDVATRLNAGFDLMIRQQAWVGSATSTLERSVETMEQTLANTQQSLSETEDADLTETLVQLKVNENRQQAALQVASRVQQRTLFDMMA
jgi:flagellar hook-associated protein 3 FlgL